MIEPVDQPSSQISYLFSNRRVKRSRLLPKGQSGHRYPVSRPAANVVLTNMVKVPNKNVVVFFWGREIFATLGLRFLRVKDQFVKGRNVKILIRRLVPSIGVGGVVLCS